MSQSKHLSVALVVVLGFGCSLAVGLGLPEITVNCDQGDNLQAVLNKIEKYGSGRVRVIGTCTGTFFVQTASYVEIVGESPESSGIQGGAGVAFMASGPGRVDIHDMRLSGAGGARASGPQRIAVLAGCEVDTTGQGVWAEAGALVSLEGTTVTGGGFAVLAFEGAEVVVEGGRLGGSTYGARVFGASLSLYDTEVADNAVGILASGRANVTVSGGFFANNGQGHLLGTEDSRLTLYNARVGGSLDATFLSLYADRGVAIEVFNDDPQAEIWGPATLFNDSFMSFQGATIHGTISLNGFSRLRLEGAVQDGLVDCESAGDAVCEGAAQAFTSGCPSAPSSCVPQPVVPGAGSDLHGLTGTPALVPQLPQIQLPQVLDGGLDRGVERPRPRKR